MEAALAAFQIVFSPGVLFLIVLGVLVGILIGALPGMSASTGLALALPFTFGMSPSAGIAFLIALYVGAEYGGSITAILLNIPGTPGAVATVFDGYPLAQQGKAGKALGISLISGTYASLFSSITLILIAIPLAKFALNFGSPAYFLLAIMGLTLVARLSDGSYIKGIIGCLIGLLLATVGVDAITGVERFTFGIIELSEGLGVIPVLLGLFGLSEAFVMLSGPPVDKKNRMEDKLLPALREIRATLPAMFRGSVIGNIIGIIPGAGTSIASLIAYNEERRFSKHPEKLGHGSLEGVAAPEAANNAVVGGALVPLLTLGIPGSASTAILSGVLMIHGINLGPDLFTNNRELVNSIFISLPIASISMLALGLLLGIKMWTKVLSVPINILAPIVIGLCILGSYADGSSIFHVWVMVVSGIVGYILRKNGFSMATLVLGLILGFMAESNFRRALIISDGNPLIFVSSPVNAVLAAIIILTLCSPLLGKLNILKRNRANS